MITITAEQRVIPGREHDVDILMKKLTEDIMESEPGCVRFDYVVDSQDPLRRLVIESYHSEEAFAQHKATTYLTEFIPKLLACLVQPPEVIRFHNAFAQTTKASFFHTGIVVPDLEKAVSFYADLLGVGFTEPGTFSIPRLEDPDPHSFELTAVLSRTEPPYLELIQASGTGIISPEKCGEIFYHGYFENDMNSRLETLLNDGPGVDAVFRMEEGGTPFAMITAPDQYGARIEYVGVDAADPLTEWARSGNLPTGIGT